MKKASVHLIYSAIILVLLIYIARLGGEAGPESSITPASTTDSNTQPSEDRFANGEPMTQQNTLQDSQSDEDELRQLLSEKAQQIETLQTRLNELTEAANASVSAQPTEQPVGQQQTAESTDDIEEQFHRHREQQEAERDAAFASAAQTAQSDDIQQRLETSIYNLDNSPRFEALDVECRGVYCNIEVSFENQDDARDFMMYQGRRIFDQADVRTTMTRSESRDARVIIKADLAPLTED